MNVTRSYIEDILHVAGSKSCRKSDIIFTNLVTLEALPAILHARTHARARTHSLSLAHSISHAFAGRTSGSPLWHSCETHCQIPLNCLCECKITLETNLNVLRSDGSHKE